MSLAQVLSAYLNMNLLILIGFLGLLLFSFILKSLRLQLGSSTELKLHYSVLLVIFALGALHPFLPRSQVFEPAAKVWSAPSLQNFGEYYANSEKSGFLSLPTPLGTSTLQADQVAATWMIIGFFLFACGGFFIFKDLRTLLIIKRKSFLLRRLGKVRVFLNDDIHVPFSYWLPFQANVVIPTALLERREDFHMAITHELQHHRHGDTRWVYVLWGLKWVCIINPAIYFWNKWIAEIQEFACDETLVDRNKVESQAYARCLVEVAQTAIQQKRVPVCATGLTFLVERNLLHRRIEKMFSQSSGKISKSISVAVGLLIASIMGATAYAANGLVQDRRVTMAQAKVMAERAQNNSEFPVIVNDLVLKQLNRYIGTPEGREFMRDSLERMESHKALVAGYIKKYNLPVELMAVPIVESGYQNLPEQSNRTVKAAGLWQFIRQTARNYGLRVNNKFDDRMDTGLLTDAAMRYLQANNLRFNDWHLSALAYNIGEGNVQKGMEALNSRDAWTLIRNGYEGDKDYLPKLMAAILIMKNPESVQ